MTALHPEPIRQDTALPPIVVTEQDYETLIRYVDRRGLEMPRVTRFLEQEIERAELIPARKVPRDVVTMNSRLLFRTNANGLSRAVTLVYPGEADLMAGKLSILTPVGVALLGLRPGQSMAGEDRVGEVKTLVVQHVLYQPEASGRFDL
jgi:regulator of nucleoside diphosphate kinase